MTTSRARPAGLSDVPVLVDLMAEFYAESAFALPRGPAARAFESLLGDSRLGRAWILEHDGEPAGHVVLTWAFSMEYGGLRGFVDDLFVRPIHRGKGLSTLGLAELRKEAVALGLRAILVETGHTNDIAKRAYSRAGFVAGDHLWMTLPLLSPVHGA